nr:chaplin [Streptomyces sp. Wb2n-11]
MRQVTRNSLITMAAASGLLAVGGGNAHAGSGAEGSTSDSPGVLSGNSVQAPVNAPINVCGNTVNVIGVLNPAVGNRCANDSKGSKPGKNHDGGGAAAEGHASNSPGVGSGNHVQVPVDAPVNVCGNSVTVGGLANPAAGNDCGNDSTGTPPGPGTEEPPGEPEEPGDPGEPEEPEEPGNPGEPEEPGNPGSPETPEKPDAPAEPEEPATPGKPGTPNEPDTRTITQPKGTEALAETGAGTPLGVIVPAGAGLLLAGAVLYRRARSAA